MMVQHKGYLFNFSADSWFVRSSIILAPSTTKRNTSIRLNIVVASIVYRHLQLRVNLLKQSCTLLLWNTFNSLKENYCCRLLCSVLKSNIVLPLLQRVLLHPDGEVCAPGCKWGCQVRWGPSRQRRLWDLQGPQPPLQPEQPHWGMRSAGAKNSSYPFHPFPIHSSMATMSVPRIHRWNI